MRIVLATLCTYRKMGLTLTECGYEDRLLSFYLLDKLPDEVLHYYVENGIPERVPKSKKKTWRTSQYKRERILSLVERLKDYEKEATV